MATAARASIVVEKLTARVFCHLQGKGGNPLTIFRSPDHLSPTHCRHLARTCEWESVIISSAEPNSKNAMSFYLPTGDPVSFCAHAAMGGVFALRKWNHWDPSASFREDRSNQQTAKSFDESDESTGLSDTESEKRAAADDDASSSENEKISFRVEINDSASDAVTASEYTASFHEGDIVGFHLNQVPWTSELVTNTPVLRRLLRDTHRLPNTLPNSKHLKGLPHLVNTTILGRTKTIVFVQDVETMNSARAPTDAAAYERICNVLGTSGLYLFAQHATEDAWECRQFPRASGYPEDPATGVAAAALAMGLHFLTGQTSCKVYQGTAMARPSLLLVDNMRIDSVEEEEERKENNEESAARTTVGENEEEEYSGEEEEEEEVRGPQYYKRKDATVSLELMGRVEIDERTEVSLNDDGIIATKQH